MRALDGGYVYRTRYARGYILGRSYMSPMPSAASNASRSTAILPEAK